MKKYILIILMMNCWVALSQQPNKRQAIKSFEKANLALQQNDYQTALQYLEETTHIEPQCIDAYLQMGSIFRRLKQYEQAKQSFLQAVSKSKSIEMLVYYFLGESELNTGDYTNAKNHFEKFIKEYTGSETSFVTKTNKYIRDCDFAIEAIKKPIIFNPINLGNNINTPYRDYFPSITADNETLIFNRRINDNEDFFVSKNNKGIWQETVPLSDSINTENYNEGAQSISPDGLYLYFTSCNRPSGYGKCDIYVSHKNGNEWSKPQNLGSSINTGDWESQPAISPDGKTLYFVSNRQGGFGGNDIYKSELDTLGRWGKPQNLGATINTPYDENTPFIHPDGQTLYFSSDGWAGFGNKDIFVSRLNPDGTWALPENLGYPINTYAEETGLIVSADGKNGFFASDKLGGYGDLDIYTFQLPDRAKPQSVTYIKGIVKDKDTQQPLTSTILVVDIINKKILFNDDTSNQTGNFLTVLPLDKTYAFNVKSEGYLFYSENFEINKQQDNKPIEMVILLEKIKTGAVVTLKNIFFETNKYHLLDKSITELNTLVSFLNENPKVNIEIQGHTDNIGNDKANELLSKNRANAVYNYLISHHIDSKRLTQRGYGKSMPLADNKTPEGQQQNRRTSFLITKN